MKNKVEKSIYKSFAEWRKVYPGAYASAKRKGMFKEISKKFGWKIPKKKKRIKFGIWFYASKKAFKIDVQSVFHTTALNHNNAAKAWKKKFNLNYDAIVYMLP